MPDQEQVSFDIDPRSVLGAIKQMNSAMEGYEKTHGSANEKMQRAIDRTAELLLKGMIDPADFIRRRGRQMVVRRPWTFRRSRGSRPCVARSKSRSRGAITS